MCIISVALGTGLSLELWFWCDGEKETVMSVGGYSYDFHFRTTKMLPMFISKQEVGSNETGSHRCFTDEETKAWGPQVTFPQWVVRNADFRLNLQDS